MAPKDENGPLFAKVAECLYRNQSSGTYFALVTRKGKQIRRSLNSSPNSAPRAGESAKLVRLLALSGMRLGEATRIEWREVDFERGQFTVSGGEVGTKNGETRIVPLFPSLRRFLEEIRPGEPSERNGRIVGIDSTKLALHTACDAGKLPRFTHHSLRHFFVSNAIEVGVDFKTIAAWIGHKDGGMLVAKRYGHLRSSHSRQMAKLL